MRRTGAGALRVILLAALLASPASAQEAEEPAAGVESGADSAETPGSEGPVRNGFDLAGALVPADEIVEGGPDRDAIRSVDEPGFAPPVEATWVAPDTPVLGVEIDGVPRAYPVHLIEYHQIVNDRIAGVPVAVTYDPLAGSPIAYKRSVGERTLTFGVSGLIYNSNFLMYDRETESLWAQFTGRAIAGPLAGRELERVRIRQEPLGRWLERAPATRVLERPAPRRIDYRYSPFSAYWVKDEIPFPVQARDRRFHAKELVLGVVADGVAKAYLGSILTAHDGKAVDEVAGHEIRLEYTSELGTFEYEVPPDVQVTEAFWFAWKAFHPDTGIWNEPEDAGAPAEAATRDGR